MPLHASYEVCSPGTDANCTDLSSHRASCYQSHSRKKLGIYKHHEVALLLMLLTKINNIMIGDSSYIFSPVELPFNIIKDAIVITRLISHHQAEYSYGGGVTAN